MKKKYISETMRLNIVNCIWSSVSGMFSLMLNKEMRGPNFKWNSDIIILHACDMVYVKFNIDKKFVKNYECSVSEYTKNVATDFYNTLLKNSGLGEKK